MKGRLWEKVRIGRMELKNRLVMPPMVTRYGSDEGFAAERSRDYYGTRAKGGVGLIIVEATYVHLRGRYLPNQLSLSDDKFIPGMRQLVEAVHHHGAKIAVQLHHGGREARSEFHGMPPAAPSPLPGLAGEVPRELSHDEIAGIITCFADAAVRAREAGFDGIELHGAHGYLIDQFLSPTSNKRTDEYGGSLEHRTRFLLEVIEATIDAVGDDFPVWVRLNACEFGVEGETLEDGKKTAQMAEKAGMAAIHVSAWGPEAPFNMTTATFQPAIMADLAQAIKQEVNIPVIAVGRITPEVAESIIEDGKADLIAIGKALLADPELPTKMRQGHLDDIKPCIICMNCRDYLRMPGVVGTRCSTNPALGRERELAISPARRRSRVLVVGGGPAGMEAARVAALKGHEVTLWEQDERLGGQLIQAALAPHKDRIAPLADYLEKQLEKLGVRVELGREATASMVTGFKADVVILAAGVIPLIPEIPGLDKVHVVQAGEVLEGKAEVGKRVAVIGGELVGCETAEYLADKGKLVTVMRRGPQMALGVGVSLRGFLLKRLAEKGVELMPDISYNEVTSEGVVVTTKDGKRKTLPADTVVLAAGSLSRKSLYDEIKGKIPEVHCIGDCVRPRTILDAMDEGYRTGLKI